MKNLINYCSQKICLMLLLGLFSTLTLFAQTKNEISGTISSSGESLVGATVLEKGTSNAVMTDIDGKYTIAVSQGAVIEVVYIGYEKASITVGDQKTVDIDLKEKGNTLNEVVAIGYGVQKKKLSTGATIQVKGDNLEKRSTTSALQALQGQTPGVQISSVSGQPGDGFKVLIRGAGTAGNSSPLYIVDGIQTGDISYLNNADIASVDVLKDAASAAIYGSQAANGVVLITTKTGAKGKNLLSFDAYYGFQNVARKTNMLNAKEYATILNEAYVNSGSLPLFTSDQINAMGNGTTWLDQMFVDNVPTQNYTLSAQGGNEMSVYSTSLSYTSQGGIVGGKDYSNYDRYTFRVNTEHKFMGELVKLGQHLTFTYVEKKGVGTGNTYNNSLREAFNTSPLLPMYDDYGNFIDTSKPSAIVNGQEWTPLTSREANPYANMIYNNQNADNNQKLIGDIYLELQPLKNLKFKTTIGIDYFANESRNFRPVYSLSAYANRDKSSAYQSLSKGRALNWDNLLSYSFVLGGIHNFDAMGGTSARVYEGSYLNASRTNINMGDLDHAWIDNGSTLLSLNGAPDAKQSLLSYFGRVGYNLKDTYLINATFRADGSSRFHKSNRWGYFPSVSAGWIVSNESWMKNTTNIMDYFKLRASWGQVGNQNVGDYQYMALVKMINADYVFGDKIGLDANTPGAYPSSLKNPNLKWETSEQLNIGFDARFLDGKLNANFDWYNKTTKDWLVTVPTLATSGVNSKLINGGDVTNKGVELGLNYADRAGSDFSYTISGNVGYNKNKVGRIPSFNGEYDPNNPGIIHGLTNQIYDNAPEFYRAQDGMPIGYFWGWKTDGIFQNQAEIDNYVDSKGNKIQADALPGDVRYKDMDGNGVINEYDKTNIGDPNPDLTFGLSFTCEYKDFDFAISSNGVAGNQIVQSYRNHSMQYANYTTRILDRWHGEGTSNTIPRVTNANVNWQFSDLYIQDGDYWRINNITLGYNFTKLIKSKLISQLRVYGSVQNPFTFTKYDGMDPDIGYGTEGFASGIDVGYYPHPRTFLFGVNVKF